MLLLTTNYSPKPVLDSCIVLHDVLLDNQDSCRSDRETQFFSEGRKKKGRFEEIESLSSNLMITPI